MSFTEESLEDKIAAIMSGNYNFGPPIAPPANLRAPAASPVPKNSPLLPSPAINSSSLASSSAFSPSPSPVPVAKKVQIEAPSTVTAPVKKAQAEVTEPATTPINRNVQVEENLPPVTPAAVESKSDPETSKDLKRVQSVFVGYGDVYEDATDNVEFDEDDLKEDGMSEAYSASVSMTDVYGSSREGFASDNEEDGNMEEEDDDDNNAEPEEAVSQKSDVKTPPSANLPDNREHDSNNSENAPNADSLDATESADQHAHRTTSFVDSRGQADSQEEEEEEPVSKVQPQLDFIPLSARKLSPVPMSVEDKDLLLDTERAAKNSRHVEKKISFGREEEMVPEPSVVRKEEAIPFREVPKAVLRGPSPSPVILAVEEKKLDPPLTTEPESPIDSKVQSLLFGEDGGVDEDEAPLESLSFEPDTEAVVAAVAEYHDDDSLNGDDRGPNAEVEEVEETVDDLAQTIRTTLPVSASSAVETKTPVKKDPVSSIPAARAPVSKPPARASAAPPSAVTAPVPAATSAKSKTITPSTLAREQAAFLLPTIQEETPAAKPRPVSVPKPSGPIKVPVNPTDTQDRSHFLARISAATSVPIEAPVKPRSTTPTSIPQRPATPPSTARSGASASAPKSAAPISTSVPVAAPTPSVAHADPLLASIPRSVPRKNAPEPVPTVSGKRSSSPTKSVINISPPRRSSEASAGAAPPTSASKRTTSPASIRKTAPVLMSTTSADEIAAASAGAKSTPTRGTKVAHSASSSSSSSSGMKEATLLASPPAKKDKPVTPGKVKTPAWVIEAAPVESPLKHTRRPVSGKGGTAFDIENTTADASPNKPALSLKPPIRSKSPPRSSTPSGAASARSGVSTATAQSTGSGPSSVKFADEGVDSVAAARASAQKARAASPNTTARSAARTAPHNTNTSFSEDKDSLHHERAVKVAVRVRPFTPAELQHGQRRTISMHEGRLVIVNPKSFEDEPDAVAAVAVSTENRQWANLFEFDNVLWNFDPKTGDETLVDQIELHRSLGLEIVENALNGVSSSCFAYGHTCTGKTYSLFGSESAEKHDSQVREFPSRVPKFALSVESGLIQRIFHDIVRMSHKNTRMFISFMEIYNEKIRDLLVERPAHHNHNSDTHSNNGSSNGRMHAPSSLVPAVDTLKLREHPTFGPYVENLTKVEVFTVQDALRLIAKGQLSRTSAQTAWNANSSRSHAVVTLELTPTEIDPSKQFVDPVAREVYEASQSPFNSPTKLNKSAEGLDAEGHDSHAHLTHYAAPLLQQVVRVQMVDLAGSEKDTMKDDDDNAVWAGGRYNDSTPNKLQESQADKEKNELRLIRRSLSTLGFIIKALTKGAAMRSLPYRDCTLTFLLRDALCGRNHTTMLATISPAHSCYEETLSTLRYAERLCEVHINRRIAARVAGQDVPMDLVTSLDENTLGPRRAILEEFQRIHQRMRGNSSKSSTQNSREILRQTLSDPQQRIARLQQATHPAESVRSSHSHATPVKNFSVNGFTKPLAEVTDEDLEQLKNSYRQLTSDVIEMQIDMDAVRTDRDTLMVELRGARDALSELEANKEESRSQSLSLTKYLRAAEKELADLHALLKKREENVERLLGQVAEERAARISSEQALQSRTKEYMARIEAMKKESKVLAGSLETVSDKHKATIDEKKDQGAQIERLKAQVKALTSQRDANAAQLAELKSQHENVGKKFEAASVKVVKLDDLEKQTTALTLQSEKTKAELAVLASEKESLVALLAQKDSQMQMQAQQSERAMRLLQLKINGLERTVSFSAALTGAPPPPTAPTARHSDEEYSQLQSRLAALLNSEGQILRSELLDTHKLTGIVKEMGVKLQELEDMSQELQLERAAREDLQRRLNQHTLGAQVEQASRAAMDHQVSRLQIELLKAQEAHKKAEHEYQIQSEVSAGSKAALEEQVTSLQRDLIAAKDELALTKTRLAQQSDAAAKAASTGSELLKLQAENSALKDHLINTQKDSFAAREELKTAQESMQADYSAMWTSVQELSKLDALKDQSIQDLIMDRDKAVFERDAAMERFAAAKSESSQLMQDLQELDVELLHAVEAGEYRLSPRGQHKSIVLHNVSDSLMFSLARRQQQHAQASTSLTLLGSSSSSVGGGSLHSTANPSNSSSNAYATPVASAPALAHPQSSTFAQSFNHNYANPQQVIQSMLSPSFQSPHSARPVSAANTPIISYPANTEIAASSRSTSTGYHNNSSNSSTSHSAATSSRHPAQTGILKNSSNSAVASTRDRSPKSQQGQGQGQTQGQRGSSGGESISLRPQQLQQQSRAPSAYETPVQPPQQQQYPPLQQHQYFQPPPQQHQQQQYHNQQPQYPQQQDLRQSQQQQQQRFFTGEEKEYSLNEEALEKELLELSMLEDEARGKRHRMKNGGGGSVSGGSLSGQSTSQSLRSSFASRSNY